MARGAGWAVSIGIVATGLGLPAAAAGDDARWLHLGDTAATATWPAGHISIDVSSLRRRGQRLEVWERTLYLPDPVRQWTWLPEDGPPERRTLWSIRCPRSAMAILTRGLSGSFAPRSEKPTYYVPAPGSADAAVLEAACSLQPPPAAVAAPAPPPLPADQESAWRQLERPPTLAVDDDDDES